METQINKSANLDKWVRHLFSKSHIPILNWLAQSLKRDESFPLSWKLRKGYHVLNGIITAKFYLRGCTKVGKSARTNHGKPFIDNTGTMILGDNVIINSRNVRCDLVTKPNGVLEIGNNISINFGASIVAENYIKIGDYCQFGPYCFILDSDAHLTQGDRFEWPHGDPIIIEEDVWLASHVTVLKGSFIGRGSTIAAGSIVSGYIPPYTIAGGIPARVIKYLRPPKGVETPWIKRKKESTVPPDIRTRVNKVIQEVFNLAEATDVNSGPANVKGWDSFGHLRLMEALEKEFNIEFTNEDVVRTSSVYRICRVVSSKTLKKTDI